MKFCPAFALLRKLLVCHPLVLAALLVTAPAHGSQPPVNFQRDVRPLLSDRCFQCHGPNEHDRQADLRLDQATGPDGAYRQAGDTWAIKPGSRDASELWRRVNSPDEDVMPPPDSNKKPLTAQEREVLGRWIDQGATYAEFWAFVPPTRPSLPDVDREAWSQNPIDRYVLQRLNEEEWEPKPAADRRTLIRRLSLDLTGLPPTRLEIQEYLEDKEEGAYERLVDRLLAKPQYGEHLAKYWLDLVRFADTNGIHHDHYREMSPYRDWVIRALNENLPYDQFVTYQVAGDLFPQPTRDQLIASGFNRLHLIIDRGTALPEESYTRNVIDRVTAFGTAFLGLTVQCAVCHDHKYDPITMRDFYQLFAYFNNLDAEPETGGRQGTDFQRGLQPPYILLANESQQAELDRLDAAIRDRQEQIQKLEQQRKAGGDGSDAAPIEAALQQARESLQADQAARQNLEASIPAAMVMKERPDPRPAHILIRGAYDRLGDPVQPNTPSFLPPLPESTHEDDHPPRSTRLDLARWLVAPDHPLTARVAVNRYWQMLFGVGLVKTAEDFGAQGEWPSHPEVLDYLAISFVESNWNVKALLKQIVMSQTYRQSSVASPEEYRRDPENRLLARGARFRLDSEVIRDQILATSGLLNTSLFGPSVKPPQPEGLWEAVTMPSSYPRSYEADAGDRIYRRSVYTFWKRGMPPPQMTILNAPTREACIARRERTNTPLQALLLLNERQFLEAARHLAYQTITSEAVEAEQRLPVIYETITAQLPSPNETKELLGLLNDLRTLYREDSELAQELCQGRDLPAGVAAEELAAWTMLVSTLYNLDFTKTRS